MTVTHKPISRSSPILHRQRGVTLIIALIMLIAMTLAGLSLMRQVGTGVVVARNLTFKQGATVAADRGAEAANVWITENAASLNNAVAVSGYYAAWCNISVNGANIPDANGDGNVDDCASSPPPTPFTPQSYNWASSVHLGDDGAGNTVDYVIHRMCRIPGGLNAIGQQCVTIGSAASGGSKGGLVYGSQPLSNTVQPYFRITTRVTGPMNTVVYTQTITH